MIGRYHMEMFRIEGLNFIRKIVILGDDASEHPCDPPKETVIWRLI